VKLFACGDVVPGCDTRWVGSDAEEIVHRVGIHVRRAHGIEDPRALVAEVRARLAGAS